MVLGGCYLTKPAIPPNSDAVGVVGGVIRLSQLCHPHSGGGGWGGGGGYSTELAIAPSLQWRGKGGGRSAEKHSTYTWKTAVKSSQ